MSKSDAQRMYELLSTSPDMPDFIVSYKPFSFFNGNKEERFLGCSKGLKKFFPNAVGKELSSFCHFGENKITFSMGKSLSTFVSRRFELDWGSQIFVYVEDEKSSLERFKSFAAWFSELNGAAKKIGGVIVGVTLISVSVLQGIQGIFPKLAIFKSPAKVSNKVSKEDEATAILKEIFEDFPAPLPNGLFLWSYSGDCKTRSIFAGYSNRYRDKALFGISVRRTDEGAWRDIFEAHKEGRTYVVLAKDLPKTSTLLDVMRELDADAVVTVPIGSSSGCPVGYVSGGYKELTDVELQLVTQRIEDAAVKIYDAGILRL